MICTLRGLWGTITMLEFWKSLFLPPLVTYSGHEWSDVVWGPIEPSRYPETWDGMVEYDLSYCTRCEHQPKSDWRRSWMI